MNKDRLPDSFRIYFWDVDWEDLNGHQDRYKNFIITRLADKGDFEQVRWLISRYGLKEVAGQAVRSRHVSPKSRSFWNHVKSVL